LVAALEAVDQLAEEGIWLLEERQAGLCQHARVVAGSIQGVVGLGASIGMVVLQYSPSLVCTDHCHQSGGASDHGHEAQRQIEAAAVQEVTDGSQGGSEGLHGDRVDDKADASYCGSQDCCTIV
jgi:hypothetical protein